MRRLFNITALTLTLGATVAVAARAQDSVRIQQRRSPRTMVFSGPTFGGDVFGMHRGRLGITIDLRADARDSLGARVSGVTPGGPADRAGVQTGDIITRFNGTRVAASGGRSSDEDTDQSRPGMRLINLASRLDAGDTVRLELLRDNRPQTMTFTAQRTEMDDMMEHMGRGFGMGGGIGEGMGRIEGDMPGMGEMRIFAGPMPMGDMELVKVNPQLAEALGVPEGLLVVSVDSSSTLGLRAGDVITAIGGRRPTSPPQAMRILSTYEPGEAIAFDVMRAHRRTTVNGKLPENSRRGGAMWRVRPDNYEFFMPRMPSELMHQFFDDEDGPRLEIRRHPGDGRIGEMAKPMIRLDGRV